MRLNQILAIENSVQSEAHSVLTRAHHQLQSSGVNGIARTYQPLHDDGEQLPPEGVLVQVRAEEEIDRALAALIRLFDVTAQKDYGNQHAAADVTVDGRVLLENVPVPYLLWLEKKLVDLRTFVDKLPVLDAGVDWGDGPDPNTNVYRSQPIKTVRTQKQPKVIVRYQATDKHPAQTDVYNADVQVGEWTTTKFSGGLPRQQIQAYRDRVTKLARAVKQSREHANLAEVEEIAAGRAVLGYIFEGVE